MSDWREKFYEAAREWLIEHRGVDAIEVTDVSQDLPSKWFCDTCGPDPITVWISYTNRAGVHESTSYYGDLGEFINQL